MKNLEAKIWRAKRCNYHMDYKIQAALNPDDYSLIGGWIFARLEMTGRELSRNCLTLFFDYVDGKHGKPE